MIGLRKRNLLFRLSLLACLGVLSLFVGLFLLSSFVYAGPLRLLDLLRRPEAQQSIWLSLWTSSLSTLLALVFAVPSAYVLTRHRVPGAGVLDVLLDLPIVLPPLVAGFSLLLLYTLLGRWLGSRTLESAGLDLRFSQPGIVLAQFTIAAPLAVRVMRAAFQEVPVRLESMARSLGAGEAETFRRISLPMARNGILAGTILVWARSVAEFGPILVFAGAVRGKTDVLPISIFLSFSNGEIENGVALSALLIVVGVLALALIRRLGGSLVVG
ncbi:MAG: ABC transporter permease [Candidatus Eisenbacteria bacterium]|nr:ABC transporter permease [Candidatus Eisenbacteria bacterium]